MLPWAVRGSPANKRRKVHTPVKYLRNSADVDAALGLQSGRPGSFGKARGSCKVLFRTPDSEASADERPVFGRHGPVSTPLRDFVDSDDDDQEDEQIVTEREQRYNPARLVRSSSINNNNPFCRVPSEASESGPQTKSPYQGQQSSPCYSSPSLFLDQSSRRYSCGGHSDSVDSMVLSDVSPVPAYGTPILSAKQSTTTRKPPPSGINTNVDTDGFARRRYAREEEENKHSSVSPSAALAGKLKRTCSLLDDDAAFQDQENRRPLNRVSHCPSPIPSHTSPFLAYKKRSKRKELARGEDSNVDGMLLDEDDEPQARRSPSVEDQELGRGFAKTTVRKQCPSPVPSLFRSKSSNQTNATMTTMSGAPPPTPCKDDVATSRHRAIFGVVPPRDRRARASTHGDVGGGGSSSKVRSRFKTEFEEQGVLGGGGFGTVYKCKNKLDGCMYAVKVTNQRFRGKASREQMFKEVYALSAMCNAEENPHVVRYFSAFVEDGRLYIQTELCDKSLQDMISAREFPSGINTVVREVARQVLEGLAHLHKHNLVHLDIKPANIFVKNGVFKVGDLGHACLARIQKENNLDQNLSPGSGSIDVSAISPVLNDSRNSPAFSRNSIDALPAPPPLLVSRDQTTPEKQQGNAAAAVPDASTPVLQSTSPIMANSSFVNDITEGDSRYMAPEMLNEEYGELNKCDIFSLGATLYEICLGRELPANGQEWHEIRNGMLDPEALKVYSPSMQELVRLMLQRDPVRRPSAQALIASGGPGGVLRNEYEHRLAREKAAADEYRKQLIRLKPTSSTSATTEEFDASARFRIRRSHTM